MSRLILVKFLGVGVSFTHTSKLTQVPSGFTVVFYGFLRLHNTPIVAYSRY